MRVIGLTGGIGSGKSTASAYLESRGHGIIDADLISREVVARGTPLLDQLADVFGEVIIDPDGDLDRKALGNIVFNDPSKRQLLDQLMHKTVIGVIRDRVKEYEKRGLSVAFIDAPLLFETGLQADCESVWLLVADERVRISRVVLRDGLTSEEVKRRIDIQMSDKEKAAMADVVIDNSGDEEELYERLDGLLIEMQRD